MDNQKTISEPYVDRKYLAEYFGVDIKTIINQLKDRGIGILLTDHNVRETLDICEKACIVNEGRVIADGDAKAILSNEKVRSVYLGSQFKI